MKRLFLLFYSFFLCNIILPEGFPVGTLVKTKAGDVPIEQIKKGDQVYSYNFNGHFDNKFVLKVLKSHADVFIKITVDGESFFTVLDQLFLSAACTWVAAGNLKVGDKLDNLGRPLPVDNTEIVEASTDVYCLIVADYENFCVGAHGFFVHNFVFETATVIIGGAAVVEQAVVVAEKLAELATYAVAVGSAGYLYKKSLQPKRSRDFSPSDRQYMEDKKAEYYRQQHLRNLNDPTKYRREGDLYFPINQSIDHVNYGQAPTNSDDAQPTSCGGGGGQPPSDLNEMQVRQKILDDEYNRQHCKHVVVEDLHDPTKYTKQSDGTYISVEDDTWWGRAFCSPQRLKPEDFQPPTNSGGKKATSCGGGCGRPPDDPNDPWWKRGFRPQRNSDQQKEWKRNTVSKQEFFNDPVIKDNYKSTRDGSRELKGKGQPLEGADRLDWDHTHCDVEAYKNGKHLGSIDPQTKRLYKPAVPNRTFKK